MEMFYREREGKALPCQQARSQFRIEHHRKHLVRLDLVLACEVTNDLVDERQAS